MTLLLGLGAFPTTAVAQTAGPAPTRQPAAPWSPTQPPPVRSGAPTEAAVPSPPGASSPTVPPELRDEPANSNAFLTWRPGQPVPSRHARPATELLAPGSGMRAGIANGAIDTRTNGYVRGVLDGAHDWQIAGSSDYYRHVREDARRLWRPTPIPPPTPLQTLANTFFTDTSTAMRIAQMSAGPMAGGPQSAAATALDHAHPNSPMLQPRNTMSARAAATGRTVRAEIEVDQNERGEVVDARVAVPSGVDGFDDSAIAAVRRAAALQPAQTLRGGWRSRWEFEVRVSRDPYISALPSMPGESPTIGVTGEVETDGPDGPVAHWPGRPHVQRRVRVISSRVMDTRR